VARLTPVSNTNVQYRTLLAQHLPPGPVWDIDSQAGIKGLLGGLSLELKAVHNRIVDLMREADPRTTSELLALWLEELGIPGACGVLPADADDQRAMLAAKVAAAGGQTADYLVGVARRALEVLEYTQADRDAVYIEVRPYGRPFRAWRSRAWDAANGLGAMFYWRIHLPSDLTAPQRAVIECILDDVAPAHTVPEFAYDLS